MTIHLVLLTCLLTVTACTPPPAPPQTPRPDHEPASATEQDVQPAESQPASPQAQLDALDPRTPVPLQPMMAWHQKQNMQAHLVAIEQITGALASQDWQGVERAASTIGSSASMQQMCEHMGAGAPGFTELALRFHERADDIKTAAKAQDTSAVLSATASTLNACTSCHATYRQHVVDAPTWQELTSQKHSSPDDMPHH